MTTVDEIVTKSIATAKAYFPRTLAYLTEQGLDNFKATLSGVIQLEEKSVVRTTMEKGLLKAFYDENVSIERLNAMREEYFVYTGQKPVEINDGKSQTKG